MTEFLKTFLFLNIQGSVLVILLLLLSGVVAKSFSGKWQRNLWVFAAVVFLLPVWKVLPADVAPPIIVPYYSFDAFTYENDEASNELEDERELMPKTDSFAENYDLKPWIWGVGSGLFLLLNLGSYAVFLLRKRKGSENIEDAIFSDTLQSMGIRHKIMLRRCDDAESPMLTGVFFPVVYMPKSELSDTQRRYIYSHELTHYKHKDLAVKWFVCIVNTINWFNPFMYVVMKKLNEACEIYCDEAVTKNMDDDGKKQYMNTILNLVVKKGENNV